MVPITLPILPNRPSSRGEDAKQGSFQLKKFGSFEFVQNVLFEESFVEYDKNYQNDQSSSSVFYEHMLEVYSILKSHFKSGSKLVEIGCGKGTFLNIVCDDAHFNYEGYDTVYDGNDPNIHRRYLNKHERVFADVVVLRHTLEHIQSPHKFLSLLQSVFNEDATIFIEVPRYEWTEQNKLIFDLTYEHVNYFSEKSLSSLFITTIDQNNFFDGQYQYCLAKLNSLSDKEWRHFDEKHKWEDLSLAPYLDEFKLKVQNLHDGSRYWVWGGATKGVLFLKHLADIYPDVFRKVVGVVDINEKKQGLFTPTTGIMISKPNDFFKLVAKNDTVIVMNPNYLNEIRKHIDDNVNHSINVTQF